ncbi:MAG: murein biosynthesis integral membrane protein MurJ [Pseudomonadales bacterium]
MSTEQGSAPKKDLSRQGGTVASMVMLSRIFGFVRDVVLSYFFGASYVADAFFVAFRIPNFFRRLFAEGAFSQAFVPVLARFKNQPVVELRRFVGHIFGNLAAALLVVVVLGWLGADYLVLLFAPGFHDDPQRYVLAVDLVRITLPYLGLISLVAFASAILNAHDRFAVPAFTPVLLNLCLISAALIGIQMSAVEGATMDSAVMVLGWGVLLAGVLQLLFQLPSLARLSLLQPPRPNVSDPGVREVGRLLVPAVFAASVAQINTLIDTILASTLITGSISWLYYSDRLMELPVGLVAVSLGTILLPNLSSLAAKGDAKRFEQTLDWGIRMALMLTIPAAAALYLLSLPIFATIFMHGALTPIDANMASVSLQAYSVGLIGWVLVKVLAPGYFAHKDTNTPFKIGVAAVGLNIAGNLALFSWMGHVGLALATSASGLLNAGLLYRGLRARGRHQPGRPLLRTALRTLGAALLMVAVLLWLTPHDAYWISASTGERAASLTGLVAAGAGTYALCMLALGVRPSEFRHRL